MDNHLRAALAMRLGHGPPFSDRELAACTSLVVTGARDLQALARLSGLTALDLVGCDLAGYDFLRQLSQMRVLRIENSNFEDVSVLATAMIWVLGLTANRITDCTLLGQIAALQSVDLRGNPLSAESRALAGSRFGRKMLGCTLDDQETWELCRELHARGTAATYYQNQEGRHLLCWTGLEHGPHPEAGHLPIGPAELRRELSQGTPVDALLNRPMEAGT